MKRFILIRFFPSLTPIFTALLCVLGVSTLAGCAIQMPPSKVESSVAAQWQAPLPHQGTALAMADWWRQQGDTLLVELIEAAQSISPNIAQSMARIESARAQRASANASLLPRIDASVAANRGVSQPDVPAATSVTAGLQSSWELDLVGANKAVSRASEAQLRGTQAQWHDARVAVAAEVASTYYSLASCSQQLALAKKEADSREQTASLSAMTAKAGLTAPFDAALARSSAAEAHNRVIQQQAICDGSTKALVALTDVSETELRRRIATAFNRPVLLKPLEVARVPAQTLTQRPDVFSAERDVVVASAQVGSAKAQQYPRLTLSGSIGALRYTSSGRETNMDTWSFGPLALTLPIFDAGQRQANVVAAQANYEQAVSIYKAKVRNAVREVEQTLVTLQSTSARQQDASIATSGYSEALAAAQRRYNLGLASLLELEEVRRRAFFAQSAEVSLALENTLAWVSLYRALGGGFDAATVAP